MSPHVRCLLTFASTLPKPNQVRIAPSTDDVVQERKLKNNLMMKKETTEIERIVEENEDRFDVDSILDKISKHGMSKITQEELDFLKNQSNK